MTRTYNYADMHCDTLLRGYQEGVDSLYDGAGNINIQKMLAGGQLLQFFAVFFPPIAEMNEFPVMGADGTPHTPTDDEFFEQMVRTLHDAASKYDHQLGLAVSVADVQANHAAGKTSAILTVEYGRFISGDLEKLARLRDLGVRAIALTWNHENCFGFPNSFDPAENQKGLKPFGLQAISEMEDLGILIDVSHLSEGGFYDVAVNATKPFIASHSNCRAIANHPRNLTDEQIRALADKGGIMGINFYQDFVIPGERYGKQNGFANHHPAQTLPETRIEDLLLHIRHAYDIGGEDLLAIGTDFDGFDGHPEIDGPDKMFLLFDALERAGFTPRMIEKFASGNVLRVLG